MKLQIIFLIIFLTLIISVQAETPDSVEFLVGNRVYSSLFWNKQFSPGFNGAGLYSAAIFPVKRKFFAGGFWEFRLSDLGSELLLGGFFEYEILNKHDIRFRTFAKTAAGMALFYNAFVFLLRQETGLRVFFPFPAWLPRVGTLGLSGIFSPNYIIPGYKRLELYTEISWAFGF